MADLGSTRVFGKLTVQHDIDGKGDANIKGEVKQGIFTGPGTGLTGTSPIRATGTTKADVGLSSVDNYSRQHYDARYASAQQGTLASNAQPKEAGKGLSTNDFTQALLSKLNGIQAGQTQNATDASLRQRSTHTGTQAISTIQGLDTALQGKVNTTAGYGLSQNNYTTAEKNKLAGLESSKFKGLYSTLAALKTANPTPGAGDYADVDLGVGSDVIRYIWDVSDKSWVEQIGVSSSLTTTQVKSMYEQNPNTNQFTDQHLSKVNSVQTGQTKNATDQNLRQRSTHTGTQATSTITGLDDALQSKVNTETGKGLSTNDFTQALLSKLNGIQAGQTQNQTDQILKARANHTGTQPVSTITGLGNSATLNVGTQQGTVQQGNDARINNGQSAFSWGNHASAGYIKSYVNTTYSAGTGLTLSGTTFSTTYGTAQGTAQQGNDARINNGQSAFTRLNIGTTQVSARSALGLGTMSTQNATAVQITGGTARLTHLELGSTGQSKVIYNTTDNSIDFIIQ